MLAPERQPTSERVGRYVLERVIARGGSGSVHAAVDLTTGRRVAIKTWTDVARARGEAEHEIEALSRVHHPGVARIVDHGAAGGIFWIAMELVEGPDLLAWAGEVGMDAVHRRAGGRQPPAVPAEVLRRILTVFRRLCAPLAFLHGEGIVHRDLKPQNVLVRPGDDPILVDLGLSTWLEGGGRERLDARTDVGGTLAYMAPEQIRGEAVDARADIYGLGASLHVVLTGRPPLPTLRRILAPSRESVRPSRWVAGTPPALDGLVRRMLAREPRERVGTAADLSRLLGEILGETAEEVPAGRAYVYRARLLGRDQPLDAVLRRLDRAAGGEGGVILVEGESGIGKTRFGNEVVHAAAARGWRVSTASCPPPAGGPAAVTALLGFRPFLRELAERYAGPSGTEAGADLAEALSVLALHEPALARLPFVDAKPAAASLPASIQKARMRRAVVDALRAGAAGVPLLLVIDDLQWADGPTLDAVGAVAQAETGRREGVLLLGLVRSDERPPEVERIARMPGVTTTRLARLDAEAVGRIVGDMIAADPPASFVRFLASRSEGNPFFVGEYVRLAVHEGLLRPGASGSRTGSRGGERGSWQLGLPVSVDALLERRLAGLAPRCRMFAEQAAVFGRSAELQLLSGPGTGDADRVLEDARELVRKDMAEIVGSSLLLSHDMLRERLVGALAASRRRLLHRRAARALQRLPDAERQERLAILAHHLEHAGMRHRARTGYLAAAARASKRHAHDEAEASYRAYLALAPEDARAKGRVLVDLARGLSRRGRNAEAVSWLDEAIAIAVRCRDRRLRARALRRQADVHRLLGRLERAFALGLEALRLCRDLEDRAGEARTLLVLGACRREGGGLDEAVDLVSRAATIFQEIGDEVGSARALSAEAVIRADQGRLSESGPLYERAIVLYRRAGDRQREAAAMTNLAMDHHAMGSITEARRLGEAALRIHRAIGDRLYEAMAVSNLAAVYRALGHLPKARRYAEDALRMQREAGDRWAEAVTLGDLGVVVAEMGDVRRGRELIREALAMDREVGSRYNEARALMDGAALERLARGGLARAASWLARARRICEEMRNTLDLSRCYCELGQLALVRGGDAAPWLARARAALEPAVRRSHERWRGSPIGKLRRAMRRSRSLRRSSLRASSER